MLVSVFFYQTKTCCQKTKAVQGKSVFQKTSNNFKINEFLNVVILVFAFITQNTTKFH